MARVGRPHQRRRPRALRCGSSPLAEQRLHQRVVAEEHAQNNGCCGSRLRAPGGAGGIRPRMRSRTSRSLPRRTAWRRQAGDWEQRRCGRARRGHGGPVCLGIGLKFSSAAATIFGAPFSEAVPAPRAKRPEGDGEVSSRSPVAENESSTSAPWGRRARSAAHLDVQLAQLILSADSRSSHRTCAARPWAHLVRRVRYSGPAAEHEFRAPSAKGANASKRALLDVQGLRLR